MYVINDVYTHKSDQRTQSTHCSSMNKFVTEQIDIHSHYNTLLHMLLYIMLSFKFSHYHLCTTEDCHDEFTSTQITVLSFTYVI